jgi:hypothetical protein
MNKSLLPANQNKFHSPNARTKSAVKATEESFDRARESALLMLAQLSLSKTVAQLKKH